VNLETICAKTDYIGLILDNFFREHV